MNAATLKSLTSKVSISSEYGKARKANDWDSLDDWQKRAHNYRVTLKYKGRQMSLDFFMGELNTDEPDAEGVLDCLLSDASGIDQDFESWASDLGYDTDSRKAEAIYKECQKQTEKLKRLLGDDFETFLYAER